MSQNGSSNFNNDNTIKWNTEEVCEERRPAHPRKKVRKNKMSGVMYALVILIISAILAGCAWLACNDVFALNKREVSTEIVVDNGEKIGQVASSLKKEGIIEFKSLFMLYSAVSGAADKITAGTYELTTNMDYHALVVAMGRNSGARVTVEITIPEGYTTQQIFQLLEDNGVTTVSQLNEAAANDDFDYDFLEGKEKGNASRLEGYLFPDTYQFYCVTDPDKVLDKMLKNFSGKMTEELLTKVKNSPYTLDEILTIASLIEKETDGSDRATIASVIYNRMRNTSGETQGYLQIDAALLYALPGHSGAITDADKQTDSPYNLYLYKGLPPTPIANPGLASIEAALNPESTSYYYYALGKDGVHHFFKTYSGHLEFLESLK